MAEEPLPTISKEVARGLAAAAKSFFSSADKVISETLYGWYPSISDKEIEALRILFWTLKDLCSSNYEEVILRLTHTNHENFFPSATDAEEIIKHLVAKGIVIRKLVIIGYGKDENVLFRPEPTLYLKSELERELNEAISNLQYRTVKEHFPNE